MSTSAVSLTPTLFEQYYVFRPPNPWSEVQAARDKLRGLQVAYKGMEKDRDKVVAYVNVLRRSGRVLAAAVCLSAHLRRYSPAPTAELGFMDGLAALSVGLGLQSLDESSRIAAIERCFRDIGLQQSNDPPELVISEDLSTDNSGQWRQSLEKLVREVNGIDNIPSAEDVQREAWTAWEARLQFLRQGGTLPPVDINYLRCFAAGFLAARILPATLEAITLCTTSDALTTALAPTSKDQVPAPDTFTFGVLAALGFDLSPELLSSRVDAQLLSRAITASPQTTAKGLLVLRLPAASQTATWRIDLSIPTLDIVPDRAQDLFSGKLNLTRYLTTRLQGALLEIDMSQQLPTEIIRCQQLRKIISAFLPNLRTALLVSRPLTTLTGIPVDWQHPVLSPPNQADAARQLSSPPMAA